MGTLYIVATPIGNLEDISVRAIRILSTVSYIACEDTRNTGILLTELKKRYAPLLHIFDTRKPEFLRYNDHTESQQAPRIIELLESGESVALVSDAGTPLVSDPGYVLVREAVKRHISVISIPGASAVLTALISSGLPVSPFLFLGYPPEKKSHRCSFFRNLVSVSQYVTCTYVMFCAPHKLHAVLQDMMPIWTDISIVICREMTKTYEQYWHGRISDCQKEYLNLKGEIVLLWNAGN